MVMPRKPAAFKSATFSQGYSSVRSISAARPAISPSARARARAWRSRWAGVRSNCMGALPDWSRQYGYRARGAARRRRRFILASGDEPPVALGPLAHRRDGADRLAVDRDPLLDDAARPAAVVDEARRDRHPARGAAVGGEPDRRGAQEEGVGRRRV